MSYKISTTAIRYSVPQKLHILAEITIDRLTDTQAVAKFQLSPKLLRKWRKWRHLWILQKHNSCTMTKRKSTAANPRLTEAQRLAEAERKIKALEKELKWQTLRAETLDKFIDISEEMLNIKIRKKPGSEQ